MPNLEKEFGFYPRQMQIQAGPVTIRPLPGLEQITSDVLASDKVDGDWIYASSQQVTEFLGGITRDCPYPARVFGLPKTHEIVHTKATGGDHLDFHIWALSFFVGMRLTSTEAGFLDTTPIKPVELVDFSIGTSLSRAVELAEVFWQKNLAKSCCAKLFEAAVHALFLGQSLRNLQFESFLYLYIAIDACFKLTKTLTPPQGNISHAKRLEWMCCQFNIPTPTWAAHTVPGGPEVAAIRNPTFHEALFMDAPLGFALHGSSTTCNLTLEMSGLVCRLLVALIGGQGATYVRSPVNTAQRYGLQLI